MEWYKERLYKGGKRGGKRALIAAVCLLFLVAISGCESGGDVSHVKVKETTSNRYSKEDMKAAREVVYQYFKKEFKGCALKEIRYIGDEANNEYKERGVGKGAEDVMVLLSTFKTGGSGGDGSLNENETYEDWSWIVARDKKGNWRHIDHGY